MAKTRSQAKKGDGKIGGTLKRPGKYRLTETVKNATHKGDVYVSSSGRRRGRSPIVFNIRERKKKKNPRKPRAPMSYGKKLKNRAEKHGINQNEKRILKGMKAEVGDLSKKKDYLPDLRKYYREAIKRAKVRVAKKPGQ